ncbi:MULTISPECIES: chain length determinant protein EpsF [unclassified Janthinobacterium]|uniref:chain length determinant protein EpsF n=1 Tax=unclassified Janthinobacterium TaxID=2610881 RepID=UPI00034D8833|nr:MULTISPECIES: chain length determinant protein EpsF [unclassified Janthinobacterium]MEC5163521.1 succinoglycan biosynthesis transport protein ExoP [Janthinobacterium sp. CG_S6]
MNFSQFLLILRARKWIILSVMFGIVVLTLAVNLMLPKSYKATTSILLNYKGVDPLTGLTMPGQLLPGYMATQIDIISSKNVALRVVDELKLATDPAVIAQFNEATQGRGTVRDWLADLLLKKLDIAPSRESSVIDISFKGADPAFTALVANSFANQYQQISIQLRTDPLRKASGFFDEQTKLLRDSVEAAQSRLSKYQQDKGIVSIDNRLDVESNRLNDLSGQLVLAEGQLMEASSRQRMAQGGSSAESPDVASNPLIQSLKLALGAAEAHFADVSQRLEKNHPQYQSAKAELDKLRSQFNEQIKLISNSVGNNAQILQQRTESVRAALLAQKNKVLELNRTRDEMNVLNKDVEGAQRAFDAASQRFSQTKIEGHAEQSDIAVLNPAVAPTETAGPRVVINTLLAVFLGALLGVAVGMLAERMNRRVRSETDLYDMLQIPVFGAIDWNASRSGRGRAADMFLPRRLKLK